jgi:hypothetical protein
MHRLFLLASVILALGNIVKPAIADDKDECRRSDDAAIMANLCGRAIDSRQYRGYDLADLHQQRARGLIRQALPIDQNTTKRYDDAITSLGEAISIVLAEGGTDRNRLRDAYYWRAYVFLEKKSSRARSRTSTRLSSSSRPTHSPFSGAAKLIWAEAKPTELSPTSATRSGSTPSRSWPTATHTNIARSLMN